MRHRATVQVAVPPIKPAGVLDDHPTALNLRFGHTTEPIRAGAKVRVWGGYEVSPKWLLDHNARAGVLGTVTRFLAVPASLSKEAVVRLDRPLCFKDVIGDFLVLRLHHPTSHWTSGETVNVELCEFEPNTRFLRRRETGIVIETAAICELL